MAVRLQMKLGVVAEPSRLPDSPDTVVVVEPSVGSVARTKGSLFLLVTSRVAGSRPREATRLTAESIRNEYYYDESAGIRDCLRKAIDAANKRLGHARDRYGLGHEEDGAGPLGIAVAVVRGHELYVATVGPAEAYLIRQARLSTLPDPHRDRGLPTGELEPDVWRGEISVGDSLVLISPNVVGRLGPTELKDAMLTLHPQAAMEHLHGRFVAADGSGSDGAIAMEAMEVTATARSRSLVPVRPAEPLAGVPDRSPIPLADPIAGGVAAVQGQARQARTAAGGAVSRFGNRLMDVLPGGLPRFRRVTPLSSRRERQRRAALAILAFVVVAAGLGFGVYAFGGIVPREAVSSQNAGQEALDEAREHLRVVKAQDLVDDDPDRALEELTGAYEALARAEQANVPSSTLVPIRTEVIALLDDLYGVVNVRNTILATFSSSDPVIDLGDLIRGPDGAPYLLDRTTGGVYRFDTESRHGSLIIQPGRNVAGEEIGVPKLLTTGGPDLVVVDDRNDVLRWRPAEEASGTVTRIPVQGSTEWGDDVADIGTFLRDADRGLYNLYVIDPDRRQILAYPPAADGSRFPGNPTGWLAADRDVASMRSMLIDGDIYVVEGGKVERFVSGRDDGWSVDDPEDTLLREEPTYTLIAAPGERRSGRIYALDAGNARVIAFDKSTGAYVEQYRLPRGDKGWSDVRAMYIEPGAEGEPDRLIWIGERTLNEVILQSPGEARTTPSPTPSGSFGDLVPDESGEPPASPSPSGRAPAR